MQTKTKIRGLFLALMLFMLGGGMFSAVAAPKVEIAAEKLTNVFIRYHQLGFDHYSATATTNLGDNDEGIVYEWLIDERMTRFGRKLDLQLKGGSHSLYVRARAPNGQQFFDSVTVSNRFLSLSNVWFWWILYGFVSGILLLYWIIKITYLLHRDAVGRRARYFLDILDEHGWVERIIQHHVQNRSNSLIEKIVK